MMDGTFTVMVVAVAEILISPPLPPTPVGTLFGQRTNRRNKLVRRRRRTRTTTVNLPTDRFVRRAGARERAVQHVESVGVLPNFSRMGSGQGVAAAAIERAHVYAGHRKGVKTPSWRRRRVWTSRMARGLAIGTTSAERVRVGGKIDLCGPVRLCYVDGCTVQW